MTTDADGRVRMEFVLPVRGLIGYRGQLLTDTRGTALLHQIGEGYGPWAGEVTHRTNGVLVSDRTGTSNAYGLFNLQERSELFIGSGEDVYEGMIVGENARAGDMDVNACKEKKLTNIRTHSHDEALRLTPPRPLTLESAIEFIGTDELVEVTPTAIRLRKRLLAKQDRDRERGRAYDLVARRARLTPPTRGRRRSRHRSRAATGRPAGPRRRGRRPRADAATHSHGMPVVRGRRRGRGSGRGRRGGRRRRHRGDRHDHPVARVVLGQDRRARVRVPERRPVPDRAARDVVRLGGDGRRVVGDRERHRDRARSARSAGSRWSRPC